MNCLFCFDKPFAKKSELQPLHSSLSSPVTVTSSKYLRKLFKIPVVDDSGLKDFHNCDFCGGCKDKINRVQCLLQQLEELQVQIASVKEDFEKRLMDSYIEYNTTWKHMKENDDYTNGFRESLLRHLNIVVDIESLKPEAVESIKKNNEDEIVRVYIDVEDDSSKAVLGNLTSNHTNSVIEPLEKSRDNRFLTEDIILEVDNSSNRSPHPPAIFSQSSKTGPSVRSCIEPTSCSALNPVIESNATKSLSILTTVHPAKELRILIERLPNKYIESITNTIAFNERIKTKRTKVSTKCTEVTNEKEDIRKAEFMRKRSRSTEFSESLDSNRMPLFDDGLDPHKCLVKTCDTSFRNHQLVADHMNQEHPEEYETHIHDCPICTTKLSSNVMISCCQIPSKSRETAERTKLSKADSIICPHCAKIFSTPHLLTNHLMWHRERRFECTICLKKFIRKSDVKRHLIIHTDQKPFKCEYCGKGFKTATNRLVHSKNVCGSRKDVRFPCDECGNVFKQEDTLAWHKKKHQGTAEYPFKCDLCDHRVRYQSMMELHRLSHFGERKYQCDKCPASFKYKNCFTLHYDVRHLGKRGRKCNICDYVGIDKQSMDNHMRTHTKETPFHCDLCSKKFKRRHHLTRHQQSVHDPNSKRVPRGPRLSKCKKRANNGVEKTEEFKVSNRIQAEKPGTELPKNVDDKELPASQNSPDEFQTEDQCFLVFGEGSMPIQILEPPEVSNEVSL